METSGPPARRDAMGPLRHLIWVREPPRPAPRARFLAYAVPVALLVLIGFGLAAGEYLLGNRDLPAVAAWLLAAGSVLPVAVSNRRPVLAWRLAYLMMFLGVIDAEATEAWPWNPVQIFAFLAVLGRLAVTQGTGATVWATAFSLVPIFLFAPSGNAWGAAVALVAIAAIGDIVYRRRRTGQLLAEQTELNELERARRAVLEERARIAREMHDVVAHHMSMIAVRAETAPYRVAGLPEQAQAELATIAVAAREALTDMRRLLGVLRSGEGATPRAPQPALADLQSLVTTAREAGLEVSVKLTGVADVPPTAGLTAYRIVQEALANAARHAPGAPVSIDVRGFPTRLELTVQNPLVPPGATPSPPGATPSPPAATPPQPDATPSPPGAQRSGHGLAGMRERATLLGGTLTAGPRGAEFVVRAVLPFGEETRG